MAKVWIIAESELPPPRTGYDLVLWSTAILPSATQTQTWAGWAETHIIARTPAAETLAFTPHPRDWAATDLAMGNGRVWRFEDRYVAWLDRSALLVPEVGRALSMAGVELIVSDTDQRYPSPFLDPLWRTVQANQIYGLSLDTSPRLYWPCEIDPAEEGFQALEREPGGFSATLDFSALESARRLFPIHQGLRLDVYQSHGWWDR